jgi:hypothetical protein
MPGREVGKLHYPTVEIVLDAIAGWINRYRHMNGLHFGAMHPERRRLGIQEARHGAGVMPRCPFSSALARRLLAANRTSFV